MPDFETLDYDLSTQSANPRNRGFSRFQFDEAPSLAEPKEFFAETRHLAWGSHLVVNMPRLVMNNVRQLEPPVIDVDASHFSDLVSLVLSRFADLGDQVAVTRSSAQADVHSPIARILELFHDAKSQGHAAEFESLLDACLSAVLNRSASGAPFIEQAKQLDRRGHTDAALDLIYDQIDEKLLAGGFDEVDQILTSVLVADLSVDLLLALLTATLSAKKRLKQRAEFFEKVQQSLRDRKELEDGLLVGLD